MKKWYLATCIVKLGAVQSINDGSGENGAVTGYAINLGLCGVDLMHAMTEAERIALATFHGSRDGNRLEEVKIKEVPYDNLCEQFQIEERGADGNSIYRSKLIYFDE